jgi:hypothetical protein
MVFVNLVVNIFGKNVLMNNLKNPVSKIDYLNQLTKIDILEEGN